MIKTGFLAVALLLSGSALAMAQQTPPPQGNGGPAMKAMMPQGHPGMGQWGPHNPMQMMRMMANQNPHFEINLGRGVGVRIDCGRDTIRDCVDATLPLLDRANAMLDKMPKMPPPPPKPAGTTP